MDRERWARIESLYHAALAKAPGEREDYLAAACPRESDVWREVASLLACADSGPATVGKRVGSYEVLGLLGAGGMGEVYRARDTRLKREVALKVLPEAFANDPARMARFQREAEVLASINHPNIAHLYGFEERAIVMELVEGETLTAPLPVATALNYARQIAEALEYAHEKGVIHRDLKPANIKATPEGVVKLLDFGLAKAIEGQAGAPGNPSESPTLTVGGTAVGVILGTAAYMSPEQAAGKAADPRADIWSFGAVLYEMLAGKRAFEGESTSETLASVLKVEPDWDALPAATPAPIVRLLRRCLAKDRKHRLQAVGDARIELDSPMAEETAGTTAPSHSRLGIVATGAAVLFFAIAAALAFIHFREKQLGAEVVRFQISAPGSNDALTHPIVSPNGRMIAFRSVVRPAARVAWWVRSLDSTDARPLPGTETVGGPAFWSPDSRFLAFEQGGKLKKVDVSGGTPQTLCDVPGGWRSGAWSRANVIIFGSVGHGLMRVSASGGPTAPVTSLEPSWQERFHANPAFLPDGRHFIYYRAADESEHRGLYLGSLDATADQQKSSPLGISTPGALYAPSTNSDNGYVLFQQEDALMAQPFDIRRLRLSRNAVLLARSLPNPDGPPRFSASETGVLAYLTGMSSVSQLTWFDRGGKKLQTVEEPGQHSTVVLSPDGTRAALSQTEGPTGNSTSEIWVYELARRTRILLTSDPQHYTHVWSPDGSRIVFGIRRAGAYDLYQKASNGAGSEDLLLKSDEPQYPFDWSSDGRFLLYGDDAGSHFDLKYLPVVGDDRKPRVYLQTRFRQSQAQFSLDGRFVAYTSNETGRNEIWVQSFPQPLDGKWPVSSGGGTQPRWRQDGKELFYLSSDSRMMAVAVTTVPEFRMIGHPISLFAAPVSPGGPDIYAFHYDVSRDGQRFLIDAVAADAAAARLPITVILNWPGLLKK